MVRAQCGLISSAACEPSLLNKWNGWNSEAFRSCSFTSCFEGGSHHCRALLLFPFFLHTDKWPRWMAQMWGGCGSGGRAVILWPEGWPFDPGFPHLHLWEVSLGHHRAHREKCHMNTGYLPKSTSSVGFYDNLVCNINCSGFYGNLVSMWQGAGLTHAGKQQFNAVLFSICNQTLFWHCKNTSETKSLFCYRCL